MSTILKALQRLEEERSANVERTLDEQVAAPGTSAQKRAWLPIGGALVGGVVVGVAALFVWRFLDSGPEFTAEVAAVASPQSLAPVAAPARPAPRVSARPPAVAEPRRREPAIRIVESEVKVIDRAPPAATRPRLQPPERDPADTTAALEAVHAALVSAGVREAEVPEATPIAVARSNEDRPAQLAAAAEVRPAPAVEPEPAPKPARVAPPVVPPITAIETEPARIDPPKAPPAEAAPAEPKKVVRASFPSVFVQSTSWHPSRDRRTAMVRLEDAEVVQVHEGDAIGPIVVEEIEPTGVFFDHEGIAIRKRVGDR